MEQLKTLQRKLADFQAHGIDDGRIRELLLDSAHHFHDAYTVRQNTKDLQPGKPVEYSPTIKEWQDFAALMEKLHFMDTEKVGVALITLNRKTPGLLKLDSLHFELNGKRLSVQKPADYYRVKYSTEGASYYANKVFGTTQEDPVFRGEIDIVPEDSDVSVDHLVKEFESQTKFCTPTYCSDKDVDSEEHREYYQLPKRSSIYPLAGNRLDQTRCRISGIHTLMVYISENFGTIFSMHKEDIDAVALNVLLAGSRKIWFVIAPEHARKFEDVIAKDLGVKERKCDSWVRHQNLYVTRAKLDEHKIHYCLFAQEVNQVVLPSLGLIIRGSMPGQI